MKIAIIGPSPVPYTIGGVENLLWGLCNTINQSTSHQCELIKLPSREHNFWDLIEDYYNFYKLDVSHFDAVICTKYPAWMVRHPNCIFYVPHCLRGLYDTYNSSVLPMEPERGNRYVDEILGMMDRDPAPVSLDSFFERLFILKNHIGEIPEGYFAFPGSFIRKIVKYFDRFGLSQSPWRPIYCISETVKARTEYFPADAQVKVVYPPSFLKNCRSGEYQYIFMLSRLDAPKRIDILIQSMKYVSGNVKLLIAGTGPQEKKLKELAAGDPRIEFLGFVNDKDVEDYYANSLVIPYFPYDEDYGLITIEAMMHKKPVITTVDAGGPTEFVVNGETGYVTPLDPKEIGEKIDYFVHNPEEARRMGENAYEKVIGITWENTVSRLLETIGTGAYQRENRKKITVTSTFPIYPPVGGGRTRIYGLYKELAKFADIEIISYAYFDQEGFQKEIAQGMKEIRIPREGRHVEKIRKMEQEAGTGLDDIAEITLGGETKAYRSALKRSLNTCDLCVIPHPYLYPLAKEYLGDIPFIYEAHDVEVLIKKGILPDSAVKDTLLKRVYETEKACCVNSLFIMTCSVEDRQALHELYGVPVEKIVVVPNGVDAKMARFVSQEERWKNKEKLRVGSGKIGVFMGSWHGPNLEACEMIMKVAKRCPDTAFLLMGSQCGYFNGKKIPGNVALLGMVSEEVKDKVFSAVDFALNPMLSGSGTNLKMFDYMSAGLPIITTTFGTRGIEDKSLFILADTVQEMAGAVNSFQAGEQLETMVKAARLHVEENFDWGHIALGLKSAILKNISK